VTLGVWVPPGAPHAQIHQTGRGTDRPPDWAVGELTLLVGRAVPRWLPTHLHLATVADMYRRDPQRSFVASVRLSSYPPSLSSSILSRPPSLIPHPPSLMHNDPLSPRLAISIPIFIAIFLSGPFLRSVAKVRPPQCLGSHSKLPTHLPRLPVLHSCVHSGLAQIVILCPNPPPPPPLWLGRTPYPRVSAAKPSGWWASADCSAARDTDAASVAALASGDGDAGSPALAHQPLLLLGRLLPQPQCAATVDAGGALFLEDASGG